jgi:hypothetical protein
MTATSPASPTTSRSTRTTWVDDPNRARVLWYAAFFYLAAWAIHTGDHIRRGLGTVTPEVSTLGTIAAVAQLVAIAAVLARLRVAPILAVAIGIPDAIGIAAVHLLPHWSSFSDAFPGAHGTGVTAFSWFAAILEVVAALCFAAAGLYAMRGSHVT